MTAPDDSQTPKWYCVRSQPRHEHVVAAHLAMLESVEVFCPRIRYKKCGRYGAATMVTEALFPGYLFVCFRLDRDQRNVRYAHGVKEIVQFGEKCISIPDTVIAEIRHEIGHESVKEVAVPLSNGSSIKIISGPFRGLSGIVTQLRPATERVNVLLDLLGRQLEAELSSEQVLPVTPHLFTASN